MKKHFSQRGVSDYTGERMIPCGLPDNQTVRKVLSIFLAHIYYSKVMENGECI
jgi:hypothetical protein